MPSVYRLLLALVFVFTLVRAEEEDVLSDEPSGPLYEDGASAVHVLSESTFSKVLTTNETWVVQFYALEDQYSQAYAPEYIKAAEEMAQFGIKVWIARGGVSGCGW
jgi:hypothetical protein